MKLYINTSQDTEITITDPKGNIIEKYNDNLRFSQSEKLLQVIEKMLKDNNISKHYLREIIVHCGPGSYTGIRVGVTTANFLGFGLNIPVVCMECKGDSSNFQQPVSAKYKSEPFITKDKSRL